MAVNPKSFADEYFGATKSFVSSDGDKRLRFNPGLLGVYSEPLAAMFTDESSEKGQSEFILPDDEFEGMEHILRLWVPIPNDTVPVNENNVDAILPVAGKYLMQDIVKKCEVVLLEEASHDRLEAMMELVSIYSLPDLSVKCTELWEERICGGDFELALDGICEGIKKKDVKMINICLPLCIWRKDLLKELESRDIKIPKKLFSYFNDCNKCRILPWNVDWRYVFDVTSTSQREGGVKEIDSDLACYWCNENTRSDQCPTCNNWFCSRCIAASHTSISMCVLFNSKISGLESKTEFCGLITDCLACGTSVRCEEAGVRKSHLETCDGILKMYCAILRLLIYGGLEFDEIDWFEDEQN